MLLKIMVLFFKIMVLFLKCLHSKIEASDLASFVWKESYCDRCWKESHFLQHTVVGIYKIGVDQSGFHSCILGC